MYEFDNILNKIKYYNKSGDFNDFLVKGTPYRVEVISTDHISEMVNVNKFRNQYEDFGTM